jgi:hypothetical protein
VCPGSVTEIFLEPAIGAFGPLQVCYGGGPVGRCLPLVLVLVAVPGCCGSFMLEGGLLVGFGRPEEGTGAGGGRLFRGSLRGRLVALR